MRRSAGSQAQTRSEMLGDKTGAASLTTSTRTSRGRRLGIRHGVCLGGDCPVRSAVALTAAAVLIVAGATTFVDAVTTATSSAPASIVFEREVASGSQLFAGDLSGTRQRQLTFGPDTAEEPRWA